VCNIIPAAVNEFFVMTVCKYTLAFFLTFLQRGRIARSAERCISYSRFTLLSVRPSIRYIPVFFVQRNEDTIMRCLVPGSTMILVSAEVKFIGAFAGDHPHENVKIRYPCS